MAQRTTYSNGFPKLFASINLLLAENSGSLESVCIKARFSEFTLMRNLKLPPHLRQLSLCYYYKGEGDRRLLTQENIDSLTASGAFRSLELHENINPQETADYSYISGFTRLTHLSVQITPANCDSVTSAVGRLHRLRALALCAPEHEKDCVRNWDQVLGEIASVRPELEHLEVGFYVQQTSISPDTLLRFERLVSFKLSGFSLPGYTSSLAPPVHSGWQWLEALAEMGRLEHVVICKERISIDLMCRIISNCVVSYVEKECRYFFWKCGILETALLRTQVDGVHGRRVQETCRGREYCPLSYCRRERRRQKRPAAAKA
jgi:hypothetical protein